MERAPTAAVYGRAQLSVAYGILLATCTAGILHAPWWAAVAGTCSLALISLIAQRTASPSKVRIDCPITEPLLILSSLLNASAVAPAAFIFGHIARWLWGL